MTGLVLGIALLYADYSDSNIHTTSLIHAALQPCQCCALSHKVNLFNDQNSKQYNVMQHRYFPSKTVYYPCQDNYSPI